MQTDALCAWSHLEPASIRFCEDRLCGFIAEPSNTWSNIGYIIAGIFVLLNNRGKARPELSLVGLTAILVGIGSTLFHLTATRFGEILDVSAMYLISSLFITLASVHVWNLSRVSAFLLYAVMSSIPISLLIFTKTNGIRFFALQLVMTGVVELLLFRKLNSGGQRPNYKYLRLMAGAFAFAYFSWLLDFHRIVCDPDNHIFGGHALWHLSNATCLWTYYKYQEQYFVQNAA